MTAENLNAVGRMTACFSFIIGTGILVIALIYHIPYMEFYGLGYIIFAFFVNIIIFFLVLQKALNDAHNQEELIATMGLMLLNIPITLFYVWLIFTIA